MILEQAMDFAARSFALDIAGWLVLISFAAAGYTLIALMLDDQATAMLGTPILVFGSAMGFRALTDIGIQLAPDKLMNMSIGMALCMLLSGVLFVVALWSWNATMAR